MRNDGITHRTSYEHMMHTDRWHGLRAVEDAILDGYRQRLHGPEYGTAWRVADIIREAEFFGTVNDVHAVY